jgi:hypothetical protein
MAVRALFVLLGLNVEDAAHPLANIVGEHDVSMRMLVAHGPRAVFILQNRSFVSWLHSTMATGGTAGPGASVLARYGRLRWLCFRCLYRQHQSCGQYRCGAKVR